MRWSLILSTFVAMQFLISVALVATQNERALERRFFWEGREECRGGGWPSTRTPPCKSRSASTATALTPPLQNRLFITLQHRFSYPGFHWALLLSPKSESSNKNDKDSHLFHITNPLQSAQAEQYQRSLWRYEEKATNVLRSRSITARVLVAKLSGTESVEAQAQRIDHVLRGTPLRHNDDTFTCRIWVEEALMALKALGGEFGSIPDITNGGRLEKEIVDFAETAKARMGRRVVVRLSDLAELDLRNRS